MQPGVLDDLQYILEDTNWGTTWRTTVCVDTDTFFFCQPENGRTQVVSLPFLGRKVQKDKKQKRRSRWWKKESKERARGEVEMVSYSCQLCDTYVLISGTKVDVLCGALESRNRYIFFLFSIFKRLCGWFQVGRREIHRRRQMEISGTQRASVCPTLRASS